MNDDQVNSLGRSALKWIGGALVAWAAAKFSLSAADAASLTTAIEAVGGAAVTVAGIWLSHKKHA